MGTEDKTAVDGQQVVDGKKGGKVAAFLGSLIAVAVLVFVVGPMVMTAPEPPALDAQPVVIPFTAEGLDTAMGTPVPVRVMGADANGVEVDLEFALMSDGSGAQLAEGEYALAVTGSPIAADGTVYRTAGAAASVTVDAEGTVALGNELVLTPIPALEVTDEQISAAHAAAKAVVADESAADTLRDAAQERHDSAVAEEERRNDPVVQAQEQGLQVLTGTVRMYSNQYEIWMEFEGKDPNFGSPSDDSPTALLMLDEGQVCDVMWDGPHDRLVAEYDKICLANRHSGDVSYWRQYDGMRVTIAVDVLYGMHDVSPYRVTAQGARVLK